MTTPRLPTLALLAVLCHAAIHLPMARAQAPAAAPESPPGTRVGIGAALLVDRDGYRGVGAESLLIPGLSLQNKWFTLFGPEFDLRLIGAEDRRWWLGARIEYRQDGYEPEDGAVFTGMARRRGGIFSGIAGVYGFDNGVSLSFDLVRAARREQGAVASIELGRTYRFGAWSLKPRVGLERASADYIGYYYGVRPGEATATRQAYAGRAATNAEFGLDVRWRLAPRQTLFANVNYERYPQAIRQSPLIQSSGIPQLVIGYQYLLR